MASRNLKLPDTASVAIAGADGRLFAPSAARNVDAIVQIIRTHAPQIGQALEIASGTGEHVTRFAAEFPELNWQPSDVDPDRIASIQSWINLSPRKNLSDPILLDATAPGWAARHAPKDLIVLVNLLHLINQEQALVLIQNAAQALGPKGKILIYGPFRRGAKFASVSDQEFHRSLTAQMPDIGYKSFQDVQAMQADNGLSIKPPIEMPASNLVLVASKPAG